MTVVFMIIVVIILFLKILPGLLVALSIKCMEKSTEILYVKSSNEIFILDKDDRFFEDITLVIKKDLNHSDTISHDFIYVHHNFKLNEFKKEVSLCEIFHKDTSINFSNISSVNFSIKKIAKKKQHFSTFDNCNITFSKDFYELDDSIYFFCLKR